MKGDCSIGARDRLHSLDAEIEAVRRRLWAVEHGLERPIDPGAEAARLRTRLRELGDQFLSEYREWQRREQEEDADVQSPDGLPPD